MVGRISARGGTGSEPGNCPTFQPSRNMILRLRCDRCPQPRRGGGAMRPDTHRRREADEGPLTLAGGHPSTHDRARRAARFVPRPSRSRWRPAGARRPSSLRRLHGYIIRHSEGSRTRRPPCGAERRRVGGGGDPSAAVGVARVQPLAGGTAEVDVAAFGGAAVPMPGGAGYGHHPIDRPGVEVEAADVPAAAGHGKPRLAGLAPHHGSAIVRAT